MNIDLFTFLALAWALLALLMGLLWYAAERRQNAGVVDLAWSLGVGSAGLGLALVGEGDPLRRGLVALLVLAWSWRLASHLARRLLREESEDGRYRRLREHWGERASFGFFWFFQAQAFMVLLFALPLVPAVSNPRPAPGWPEYAAIALFALSLLGESLADRQLERFRADPAKRGRTCREGLWRYSRHPNYFFEWLHWWAYLLLAIGSPIWWLSLAGPLVMFAFLFRLTGIPYTEARALESRGEDYRDYQRTTSAFFPWFPKEST